MEEKAPPRHVDRGKRREVMDAARARQKEWKPPPRGRIGNVLNQRRVRLPQPVDWTCANCGSEVKRYWQHCPYCGPEHRRPS